MCVYIGVYFHKFILISNEYYFQEALKKADEIFGPENNDLYLFFEGLLMRHPPA